MLRGAAAAASAITWIIRLKKLWIRNELNELRDAGLLNPVVSEYCSGNMNCVGLLPRQKKGYRSTPKTTSHSIVPVNFKRWACDYWAHRCPTMASNASKIHCY